MSLRVWMAVGAALLTLAGCQADPSKLRPGTDITGALEGSDADEDTGAIIDVYTLRGREGQQVTVTLSSTEFDPYLYVRGPGNLAQDNDDDPTAQGSLNARLVFTFPENGEARIYVTSYERSATGAYTLAVQEAGAPQAPTATEQQVVAVGQTTDGSLAMGDAQLESGEYVDRHPYQGVAGQTLEITLTSDAFDPYVAITGPNGFQDFNDDDVENNTRNSRLVVTLPEAGDYIIHATSYAPGEAGAYRLAINPTTITTPGAGLVGGADELATGQAMSGTLAQGDTTLQSGEFTDRFRFMGESGQRVTIDMRSTQFDPYLILVAPSGGQEDNDDATPGDTTHSRIETVLAETGEYAIVATSYRPGETGAYTVNLQQGGAASAQTPITGPSARRVFAVSVGISDYPGGNSDLPFTAEDARKMRDTLARQGVLASESVTLIDGQATRAAVRQAFQRVAAAAGPDDLFLFFYSGHGSQQQTQSSATEPDGRNETIELVDGPILDDELAQMFRQVRSRTALLVLDACFSGGFARDVVSQSNVMGLFSSEEDLTSAVADKFQAGGYLSHFMQTGLGGDADENRDRVITAGELSAYVRRQFAEQARNVSSETMDGQRNYQFVVVDRGGVQVDAPVLALR